LVTSILDAIRTLQQLSNHFTGDAANVLEHDREVMRVTLATPAVLTAAQQLAALTVVEQTRAAQT
jgi:CheY-specific phosphatase CheX